MPAGKSSGCARIECRLSLVPSQEEVEPEPAEPPLQVGDEREGLVGQDAVRPLDRRTGDDDTGRGHQDTSDRRTVASIRPCGSVVAT